MSHSKRVEFLGSALTDLRAFPASARRETGYQIDQVQQGGEPDDWKPMGTIGAGDSGPGRGWRIPGDLYRQVCRHHLCIALLPEKNAENQQGGS